MTADIPKISIITPTLNQGEYIEQTIKSVLGQKYPHLEYIIMDGGSTDNTLKIIKKYSSSLIWYSAEDKGQSDAINKGIKRSTGEIVCYLNSDDFLAPDSLQKVADFFSANKKAVWMTGKCRTVDRNGREGRKLITLYKNFFLQFLRNKNIFLIIQFISQPSTFWRRQAIEAAGLFDADLDYDMDYDYWLRIWRKYPLYFLDENLAFYRIHPASKAYLSPEKQFNLEYQLAKKYTDNKIILFLHLLHSRMSRLIYKSLLLKNGS